MKKVWLLLFFLLALSSFIAINDGGGYRQLSNNKFNQGEKLTYLVHYGVVNAGEAIVTLDKNLYTVNNRACYKVDIQGKTIGFFSWTYKVDDLWQSYIDTGAIIPHKFYRNIKENNYTKVETVTFDHFKGVAQVKDQTGASTEETRSFKIPKNVQDMVSGYYYLRTLDFDHLKVKDTLVINGFFEDKIYDMQVVYLGKERLQTKFGKVNAAIISPVMPENQLFSGRDAIKMWVSDDPNRVPLRIEVAMFVGAFELDLIEHKGLKHKFSKK